ncbi:MAG: hypothetical protein GY915_04210 [bacterium]|nr:hypothetical protein [bacterium]
MKKNFLILILVLVSTVSNAGSFLDNFSFPDPETYKIERFQVSGSFIICDQTDNDYGDESKDKNCFPDLRNNSRCIFSDDGRVLRNDDIPYSTQDSIPVINEVALLS